MLIFTSFFILNSFATQHKKEYLEKLNVICDKEKYVSSDFKQKIEILAAIQVFYYKIVKNLESNYHVLKFRLRNCSSHGISESNNVLRQIVETLEISFKSLKMDTVPTMLDEMQENMIESIDDLDNDEGFRDFFFCRFNNLIEYPANFIKGQLSLKQIYEDCKNELPRVFKNESFKVNLTKIVEKFKFLVENEYGSEKDLEDMIYLIKSL